MHKIQLIAAVLLFYMALSCTKETVIDEEKPVIDLSVAGAFPQNCDTLYIGETFTFKARFTDNVALGSFSLDIHHNFDHHSHSTEVLSCELDPKKTAENPFLFIQDYTIPEDLSEHIAIVDIAIPGDIDTGDYHLMIRVTDKEGWQTMKGLSIKIHSSK